MFTFTFRWITSKCYHLLAPTIILLNLASLSVSAHQQKLAYTTVSYNSNTENIEVMHRFLLHDAEHAVKKLFAKNADIIADPQTRSRFSEYMENKFNFRIYPATSNKLQMIGHETDGRYLWIYQEIPMPDTITEVSVNASALQEIWPDQVNRVNIELGQHVETLIFTAQSSTQNIKIKL